MDSPLPAPLARSESLAAVADADIAVLFHFCDSGRRLALDGQGHGHRRTLPHPAVDRQHPAVPLDDVLDDGEAKAGPAAVPASRRVYPIETARDEGQVLPRN